MKTMKTEQITTQRHENKPDRPSPRNIAACYHLTTAQIKQVEKIMCRTHEGTPAILEMPEGPQDLIACWIYASDWLQIGTITPKQAIRL